MNNATNKAPYSFRLLEDESLDKDLFEDKTHERIAESLFELVTTKEKGITIGLEGPWGSGKSTVISILRHKLKEKTPDIPLIQFDAWAHEGDPLRRIFLEHLIGEVKEFVEPNAREELDKLQKEIAKRKIKRDIHTIRATTALGKWLSIAMFFVPLGVAFLSKVNFSALTLWGSPYWLFIIGLLFSGAPLLVILGNLIHIIVKKERREKGIFSSQNWAFLQEKADQEIIQEVSEEDERTSIEFERYFEQIIKKVFDNSKIKKLVLVIDNLDRVDIKDALKIWSTLQTFLAQRTQIWTKQDWFEKIWIIVPYDSEGLSRLWNKIPNCPACDLSKPFFDKCFQLRIEVPKPIFTGWENFARQMMEEAFVDWPQKDKDEVIRVLRMTRKDLTDIPTPRKIKNYINRAGFLASQWGHKISMSSIAYYVCWRELEGKSIKDIKTALIKHEPINANHKSLLPETWSQEIAGLVFGVEPEKGYQLLLEPEIHSALRNGDSEHIKNLLENHGEGFWHVFNYHIEHHGIDLSLALNAAKAIYEDVWTDHSVRCTEFVNKVTNLDVNSAPKEIKWDEQEIDKFVCLIKICRDNTAFNQNIYKHLIECLSHSLNKGKGMEWEAVVKSMLKIIDTLLELNIPIEQKIIEGLTLSDLNSLSTVSSSLNCKFYKWLSPPENIVDEIQKVIEPGKPLPDGLNEAVYYSIDADIQNGWDTVLTQCQQYINRNKGDYSNQSDEIFRIINTITFKLCNEDKINQIASNIANSGQYHNLLWHRRAQNLIQAALFCAYVFKNELQSKSIQHVGQSVDGFQAMKNFWATSNSDNAKEALKELKNYNLWTFLWELIADDKNQLAKDIIIEALEDKEAYDLFRVEDSLAKLKDFSALFGQENDRDTHVLNLIEKFSKYAELEKEIITATDLNIIDYDYELYLIITHTKNREVISKVAEELQKINKEEWLESLKEDTYLTSLAIEVKKKRDEFCLENDFMDALIEFITGSSNYTDWQKDHRNEIVSLMCKSFKLHFSNKITEHLKDNLETIPKDTFDLHKEYFNHQEILKNPKVIQNALEKSIADKDIERLRILSEILEEGEFTPEKHFPDVIRKPLQDLYQGQDEEEVKTIIKFIAEKFSVELEEEKENNEGDKE